MVTAYKGRFVTGAIIKNLRAGALLVGDGIAPDGGGWASTPSTSAFVPYVVVHPMSGGSSDGPLDDPDADANPLYQVDSWGATREQCELTAEKVDAVMLTATLVVEGRSVMRVARDWLPGARRDDAVKPSLWMAVGRYRLYTTPS